MQAERVHTLIIGGGLSGIYAASLLAGKDRSLALLEARDRIGGRILCTEYKGYYPDMGPSWYWPMINPTMDRLVRKLRLPSYPQFETGLGRLQGRKGEVETIDGYPMDPPGYRLQGGMAALIQKLERALPRDLIRLNHPVCEVQRLERGIRVVVGQLDQPPKSLMEADHVILALPPRLAAGSILFTPDFSHDLTQAMLKAGTWMAGQGKFFALYERAEWRESGLSGQGFSYCGPLGEIHDGSAGDDSIAGLTGFVGIPALRRKTDGIMIQAIVRQLETVFGPKAGRPVSIHYKDWAREAFTATDYDKRSAHAHPEFHPPQGRTSIWNGHLHLAGTETAPRMGGYLEGALLSGKRAAKSVLETCGHTVP